MTLLALSFLAIGAAYVGFNTWRNAQATRNIDHVLNDAEAKAKNE